MNDTTYTVDIHAPYVQRRTYLDVAKGNVQRFYVQLEYNKGYRYKQDDDWEDIAWFDHQPENELGHDIRDEGLHMDIYHPTATNRKVTEFPNVDLSSAPGFCERYFDKNYREICSRYFNWCGECPPHLVPVLHPP